MKKLFVLSKKDREILDITTKVEALIRKQSASEGFCHLFLTHTTAALTTTYFDPAWELDIIDAFEIEIPKLTTLRDKYLHNHHVAHLPSHVTASYFGPSLSLPFKNGRLILGKFQRVVLIELNGPRKREVILGF